MLLYLYSIILISWFGGGGISHIAQSNELIKKAEYSYQHRDFAAAAKHYGILVDSLHEGGERAVLNLAHSYYHASDTAHASDYYHRLTNASNMAIRSVANQQLGVMAAQRQDIETAASYLKAALKADPTNNLARHNYIKIKQLQNKKAQQQPQNKDQKQDEKQPQDNKGQGQNQQDKGQSQQQNQKGNDKNQGQQQDGKEKGQGEQSDKQNGKNQQQSQAQNNSKGKDGKGSKNNQNQGDKADAKGAKGSPKNGQAGKDATAQPKANAQKLADGNPQNGEGEDMAADPEQLKKMKISAEKAKMILESMRSSEVQYLQQRKHKTESSNRRNKDKPDW